MIATLASLAVLAPAPPTGNWTATTLKPLLIAKRVDQKLATVSQKLLTFQLDYQTDQEGHAMSSCRGTIVSPSVWKLQIPLIKPHDRIFMYRQNWVSDGKRFGYSIDPKLPAFRSLSTRPAPPANPLSIWFAQFPTVILSGIGRPARNFQNLLADANRKQFTTLAQTRTLVFQGRTYHSNRLVLTKGPIRYEIVFDADQNLPVNVINTIPHGASRWALVNWQRPAKPLTAKDAAFS